MITRLVDFACKKFRMPARLACRYCGKDHAAESYYLGDDTITIDYGKCGSMKRKNDCLRMWAPVSEKERQEIRDWIATQRGEP